MKVRLKPAVLAVTCMPLNGFNSMKVRLKPIELPSFEKVKSGFNSMKVRLKRIEGVATEEAAPFQFHEGPIKTRLNIGRKC